MQTPIEPVRKIRTAQAKIPCQLGKNGAPIAIMWTNTIQTTTGQSRPSFTISPAPADEVTICAAPLLEPLVELFEFPLAMPAKTAGSGPVVANGILGVSCVGVNKATDSCSFIFSKVPGELSVSACGGPEGR